jgi:hypothetical protein
MIGYNRTDGKPMPRISSILQPCSLVRPHGQDTEESRDSLRQGLGQVQQGDTCSPRFREMPYVYPPRKSI